MQNSNWEQVREIFFDALEIETKNREDFLDKRCGADVELRGEIDGLLEEHFEVDDIFDQPVFEVTRLLDENGEKRIEKRFGKYKIVREIGAGGMGTVFLAERDDGDFEQKVAVKVSRQIVADKQTVKRFMFERQILASLNHPFIAKLHDGGIADDGSPFLIMEYIEGSSITDFVDEHNLNIKERLELFVQVCEGVTFAHRNLIVHRDVKPSNILITENGTPKLLDFGLAKLLETNQGETSTKTATIFQALTPAYASPEQIQGKPISTASDVYSLGVVLYELLTGNRPYSFADKNLPEILQTLETTKIAPPSEAQNPKSQDKQTNPKSQIPNPKSLKGDLDTIILKALRREPESRYGSVEKFADDINRHLNGLPITARPATAFYQASKFYGRNKVQVLAGLFIIFSLIAGIAVALWQAKTAQAQANIATDAQRQAEIETDKAKSQEVKAKSEEEKAKKISNFMAKVISYGNPSWHAEGSRTNGEAKVIDVLFEMSDKIETEFPHQPDIQAELHHKFGEVFGRYWGPGKTSPRAADGKIKAHFHRRRALELRRQYYGEHHELVAKDLYYWWSLNHWEGKPPKEIAAILAQAINMMRETNPKNLNFPYMLSDYANRLGSPSFNEDYKEMFLKTGRPLPAIEETREAYRRAALPPTDEDKYQLAERYLKEALPIFREHYKESNQAIIQAECSLAFVLIKQNKLGEFDGHNQICRQGTDELDAKSRKMLFDRIEEVLAENSRLKTGEQ